MKAQCVHCKYLFYGGIVVISIVCLGLPEQVLQRSALVSEALEDLGRHVKLAELLSNNRSHPLTATFATCLTIAMAPFVASLVLLSGFDRAALRPVRKQSVFDFVFARLTFLIFIVMPFVIMDDALKMPLAGPC